MIKLFDETRAKEITRLMMAVGDEKRLQLLFLLGDVGRLNVNEITSYFKLTRPAISHHLKVLKDAGAVDSEKQGQEVYYWLNRDYLAAALRRVAEAVEDCKAPE